MEEGIRSHFPKARHGPLVAEQRFGGHDDERLAEVAFKLTAQRMEIVGRRGAVEHLHVVFGAKLQETLGAGRRVLGPLTFIAMRQQHHQPAHAQPFAFARGDELVDDHLCAVDEIAELGFPDSDRIGLGQRIAILEPEHRLFGKQRVDDLVARLIVREIVERSECGFVFLIVEHRMALRERAALDILPRKADRVTIIEKRSESQRLGGGPVDALALGNHLLAVVEEPLDGAVGMKIARNRRQLLAKRFEPVHLDTGDAAARPVDFGKLDVLPGAIEPVGLVGAVILPGLEFAIEPGPPASLELIEFLCAQNALINQFVAVDFQRGLVGANGLVHQRLGEAGLVALIVPEPAVAEHVDDHGTPELLAELDGDLGRINYSFRIVAIAMEDRRLDHLGHVGRVGRRAREVRRGGEPDLVVDHEMDRPAGAVTLQSRKRETFSNHALPGKGGIAMQQERQDGGAVGVARIGDEPAILCRELILLGAGLAQDHRVDDFQMAGICRQRKVNDVAVELAVR